MQAPPPLRGEMSSSFSAGDVVESRAPGLVGAVRGGGRNRGGIRHCREMVPQGTPRGTSLLFLFRPDRVSRLLRPEPKRGIR